MIFKDAQLYTCMTFVTFGVTYLFMFMTCWAPEMFSDLSLMLEMVWEFRACSFSSYHSDILQEICKILTGACIKLNTLGFIQVVSSYHEQDQPTSWGSRCSVYPLVPTHSTGSHLLRQPQSKTDSKSCNNNPFLVRTKNIRVCLKYSVKFYIIPHSYTPISINKRL